MFDLIFGAPWWLLLTLAVAGLVVAWTGNQRQDSTTRGVGLGIVALAVLLLALGFAFETDQAKVKRLNGELVQSVVRRDWSKMGSLLDPHATLGTTAETQFNTGASIVDGAKIDVDRWGLKSVSVTGTEVRQDGSGSITVDVAVFSRQDSTESFGIPGTRSDWQMLWERTGKEWRCSSIKCLGIGGEKSAAVGRYLK